MTEHRELNSEEEEEVVHPSDSHREVSNSELMAIMIHVRANHPLGQRTGESFAEQALRHTHALMRREVSPEELGIGRASLRNRLIRLF